MKRKNGEGTWGTKHINGHEYVYYRDSKGKYFYGKTQKEVKEKADRQRRINDTAKSVYDVEAKPSTTLYNYTKAYIESIKMTIQPYTYYNYTHMVDNMLKNSKLGRKQLAQITPDMITNYYSELAQRYSHGTVVSINKILKGPLHAAEDDGFLKHSTVKKIRLPKERYCKPVEDIYVPNIEEMKYIEEICLEKKNGKYKMMNNGLFFVVILHTGLRLGELIALHWNKVDMDKRTLTVDKSASYRNINGGQEYEEKEPKSKSSYRTIPFDDKVYEIFTYLKEHYPSDLDKRTGHVFINKKGHHMAKSSLEQTFNFHVRSRMGNPRITPHALRHAYSSYLAAKKVNPKVIAKLLGHASVNITLDTYVEGYEDEMREASDLFNDM